MLSGRKMRPGPGTERIIDSTPSRICSRQPHQRLTGLRRYGRSAPPAVELTYNLRFFQE